MKEWEARHKFCSWECRKNPDRVCENCGVKFRARGTRKIRCCSYECARQVQSNYKGGVSRDPDPSRFAFGQRQKVWKRDKVCQDCGVEQKDMVVHHMTFTKEILPDSLLVLVCRTCHQKRHYEHDKLKLVKI
jgi:hypothetical protein